MQIIEDLLVGLIGRPVLKLIKWFRWLMLIGGLAFNTFVVYDPIKKTEVSSEHTFWPLVVGFLFFCVGTTIKRYDEIYKEFMQIAGATWMRRKLRATTIADRLKEET